MGELDPANPAGIQHALKLELCAEYYYFGGGRLQPISAYNGGRTQYVWPATGSDSCSTDCTRLGQCCYKGTNALVVPGALLALPPLVAAQLQPVTVPGRRIRDALSLYGGYLVDDTGSPNSAAVCMEAGVNDEMRRLFNITMTYPHGVSPSYGGDLYADLLAIFRALHVVTNNKPGNVGGGGVPLAPLAPPICGAT